MQTGHTERVTGYLGERAVERFFLERGVNARVVEFEPFDLIVVLDKAMLRCQVKTTRGSTFSFGSGRSRKKEYDKNAVDFYVLVQLEQETKDTIWFVLPNDIGSKKVTVSRLKTSFAGEPGWKRVRESLEGPDASNSD